MTPSADRGGISRLGADGLLLVTALIWGVTFVAQKEAAALVPPMAFVAARFLVSALALAPFALWEFRRESLPPRREELRLAAIIGLTLFLGTSLQQAGIETTSATNAGFLTACYVVLTPFVVWALVGRRPRALVIAASFFSLFGAWLLSSGGAFAPPGLGDGLVLIADFAWATGIALTPIYLARGGPPFLLALVQYALCAALATGWSGLFETVEASALANAAGSILFSGLLAGAVGFTMQIFAQRHTPPAEAALILSLESVFAALAGAVLLGERLTTLGAVGCMLILAGAFAVEIEPLLFRRTARA